MATPTPADPVKLVVALLWADAAANEVLIESDNSQNSSFVAGFRPMRFVEIVDIAPIRRSLPLWSSFGEEPLNHVVLAET